jgi:hypothetical protein
MVNKNNGDIGRLFREGTAIDEAMNAAVRDAVLQHKQKGLPLAVWRDGKVAWVSAEEIETGSRCAARPPDVAHDK